MSPSVIGVDGCPGGWVGVVLGAGQAEGGEPRALAAPTIRELVAAAGPLNAIAVDIPIGLPDAGVRQADRLARARVGRRASSVLEVRPEVSFAEMAGAPLAEAKSTWGGAEHRRALLARVGIALAGDLGLGSSRAGVDDVLDAAAAAWTARRYAAGEARSLPDPPERFSDGWPAAIWV